MNTTAMYAGSFDPFTRGHADIVERGLMLFDRVIIAIGINESKRNLFSPDERLLQISRFYKEEPRVEVYTYNGLTVSFAQEMGVRFLLRGVRSSTDMEYERTLADTTCEPIIHTYKLNCSSRVAPLWWRRHRLPASRLLSINRKLILYLITLI